MGQTLTEIARSLKNSDKKVQLIYAFNGTGKTRLSREFKELVAPQNAELEDSEVKSKAKIIYYNAFTEDLFYWDNDLNTDINRKLLVHPNGFTESAFTFLKDEGQDGNIITNFQNYTNKSIKPNIKEDFKEISFDYLGGGNDSAHNIKISKGEESNLIWCVFFSLIQHIIKILNEPEEEQSTNKFNDLDYIFIDDPVSSLDDNHLIELAVDLSELIKIAQQTKVKFIISTHNPLFYNVLCNELSRKKKAIKYHLQKLNDGTYLLKDSNDSPFSYHIFLLEELKEAISLRKIHKYHFNLLRNVLEKTATYLGYNRWEDLIPMYVNTEEKPVVIRLINLYSHSKHSGYEMAVIKEADIDLFTKVFNNLLTKHSFRLQNMETPVVTQQP